MKTKKEHPVGNQVQNLNTFFGCENLSIEDHFKVIDNFIYIKEIEGDFFDKYTIKLQRNLQFAYDVLKKYGCSTVGMLIPPMGYISEARLRRHLCILMSAGRVAESKKRYKCKVSGSPAHYYMALPPTYWYENNLQPCSI